ncbi:hypothetical protein [Blastococcus sp. CT_GayMR16]|uniref:hypothetical protein n=1 Tax=Blastococcus sp. CT_GayMR16 TaxID=2559607 RepID=UPI001073D251|nr:hypothetical protein [Blastococcus sp. CT_GayMR16]TFV83139.1 hypothetical protein E4P38_21015 [Blastococcus sp. CT_GayMR16]
MSGKLQVWSGHAGDGDVALGVAVARTPGDQQEAQRESHDFVVQQTGRLRAGPIQWAIWDGEEGLRALEQIDIHDPRVIDFVRVNPGAVVVVAMAPTDKPRRSRRRRR